MCPRGTDKFCGAVIRMWNWIRQNWPIIPITLALILLAIALFLSPANFLNLAWFALVALTAVYAYVAVTVIRATSRQTEETKRMIDEMRQSRLDAVRPSLSLQPGESTLGSTFSSLYLRNSGGVAREVKIDINITNAEQKQAIFVPAIDRDHMVYLPINNVDSLYITGGVMNVHIDFIDSYNQSLTENLSLDFSKLKEEWRKLTGQYSELNEIRRVLENIERSVHNIERKFWST